MNGTCRMHHLDPKTGELVDLLFFYRGRGLSLGYFNVTLIPMLCHKAGIPTSDSRGRITSHRARATIATQLFNAREPLSLFELQAWLGHQSPNSTQHYAKITPTKLAKSYSDAGYFERNVRMVDVLLDQDAIKSGGAAEGQPWRFYDLGHGYCTFDFFDQCPHRMACAKCSFYRPKGSSEAQMLEAKANLLRLKQEIPLTDDERAAVDDGLAAMEKLCEKLANVPTPAGPTPMQLRTTGQATFPMIVTARSMVKRGKL
jgi:Phage integrase family